MIGENVNHRYLVRPVLRQNRSCDGGACGTTGAESHRAGKKPPAWVVTPIMRMDGSRSVRFSTGRTAWRMCTSWQFAICASAPDIPLVKMSCVPVCTVAASSLTGCIHFGCRFAPRCPYAGDICRREMPALEEVLPDHFVACHKVREINSL